MSIPNLNNQIPLVQYNASSGQTEFSIAFYIFDLNDVLVYVNNVLKTIVVDYTIKKNDGTAISSTDLPLDGAKLVFNTGQTEGAKISINRDIPISRFTQFTTGGAFFADAFNTELTRILAIQQQLSRDINRSLRLSPSDAEGGSLEMPTGRADTILAFNSLGNLILTKLADIDKANVSLFMATLLDDTTAQAARTTLDAQQLNANLSALANLTGASNKLPYFTGAGAMAVRDLFATTTTQGVAYLSNPITVSNNVGSPNDTINFGAGTFITSAGNQIYLPAITKKIQSSGTWTAGSGQNGLDTGARAANTFYRTFVIQNNSTLAYDILFSNSSYASPTVPSGYTNLGIIDYAFIRVNYLNNIAASKWHPNDKRLVLGVGESIEVFSGGVTPGIGIATILNTTEPLEFVVRLYLQTTTTGGSDITVYGSEQSSSDVHDAVVVATNNLFQATGGGSVFTSDGKIYWKNFSVSGGVSNQTCKIKSIKLRS